MSGLLPILLAALTSSEAIAVLLNSPESSSRARYEAARQLVEQEAAQGKPLQQFVLGVTLKDAARADRYLRAARPKIREMAETKDNPLAWYLLSVENNDFKLLRKAADKGNVQALNALGTIATQEAFSRNLATNALEAVLKQSLAYFRAAAAKRDPNGYINMGTCYQRGLGCEPDLVMAYNCFRAAAEAGHPEGMDYLSACYELGHGVRPDPRQSLYWRMRGRAARGDETAREWLRNPQ